MPNKKDNTQIEIPKKLNLRLKELASKYGKIKYNFTLEMIELGLETSNKVKSK
jgi:predicted DNA-binding protein